MTFKGPFQLKPFCDSVPSAYSTTPSDLQVLTHQSRGKKRLFFLFFLMKKKMQAWLSLFLPSSCSHSYLRERIQGFSTGTELSSKKVLGIALL